jgi:DNA-binding protein YbaB
MPGFTVPDNALQLAAHNLLASLRQLEINAGNNESVALDPSNNIEVRSFSNGTIKSVTITPSLLVAPDLGFLSDASLSALRKALLASSDIARQNLKSFVLLSASLPGFPSRPPLLPDVVGFREGTADLFEQGLGVEDDIETRYLGSAANGQIRVFVNASQIPVAVELDASIAASQDRLSLDTFLMEAANSALALARSSVECRVSSALSQRTVTAIEGDRRPGVLLVAQTATLNAADTAIKNRLFGLGFNVTIKAGAAVQLSDTLGKGLVLISESTSSGDVGTRLVGTTVPMLVFEPALFDELQMTAGVWQTDQGDKLNQTQIQIVNATHPLAAGFAAGNVTVNTTQKKYVWGKPGTGAVQVATVVGDPTKSAIFAYETGATMVGAVAPSRRIGWFAGTDTIDSFNADGWKLFDAAVKWVTATRVVFVVRDTDLGGAVPGAQPVVLFVINSGVPSVSDAALAKRLTNLGLFVHVRFGPDVVESDTVGKSLVVISESVDSASVLDRLTNAQIPMIVLEPSLFDDLKMTSTVWQTDFGDAENQTALVFNNSTHPVSGGKSGQVTVSSSPGKFVWGKPADAAVKIAHVVGQVDRTTIFAYEAGAQMVGMVAPAPRVGWFAGRDTPANFNETAWRLFDGAVGWAIATETSDAAILARLVRHFGFEVTVTSDLAVQAADTVGAKLVVVSESAFSADLGTKLRDIAVPVIVLEPAQFDEMGMTAEVWQTDQGDALGKTQIEIVSPTHPLAGGLAGTVTVTTGDSKFIWGKPSSAASKVAKIPGTTDQWAVFGYDTGSAMVGMNAPARRVGLFPGRDTSALLTANGWRFFDAAVAWTTSIADAKKERGVIPMMLSE